MVTYIDAIHPLAHVYDGYLVHSRGSGGAFGDDEFFGLYRRVAQAILKTIPGAHREEEPELDVVSIQPG